MIKKFALIGAAGYIAEKHMQAIKNVGGELVAALDPHDSVGILDKYFPDTKFFTEEHRFRRFLDKNHVDYVSICSPNYLHCTHILTTIEAGANVICEKPVVIDPEDLQWLRQYSYKIHPILQMRQHPIIRDLVELNNAAWLNPGDTYKVVATYKTYRGPWYQQSWKGDKTKSGGLAVNIGVHLFDLLIYLFGDFCPRTLKLLHKSSTEIIGSIALQDADVYFHLDINSREIERSLEINDQLYNLNLATSKDLHTKCYQDILNGKGLSISDAEPSLLLATEIEKCGETV